MSSSIGWEDLAEMMVRALRQLGERELPLDAQAWIETLHLGVFLETEAACRGFLQNSAWPQTLPEPVRMLLRLRCLFVLDCILHHAHLHKGLEAGTAEHRLEIYFFAQWLRDYRHWLAQRNPAPGFRNFPFDPWEI